MRQLLLVSAPSSYLGSLHHAQHLPIEQHLWQYSSLQHCPPCAFLIHSTAAAAAVANAAGNAGNAAGNAAECCC